MEKKFPNEFSEQPVDEAALVRELRAAQAAALRAPVRRRAAVMAAKAAGWTEYRIAREMSADQKIVRAVLAAASRPDPKEPQ